MKPLDPRLLRAARAVRTHLAVTAVCGVALTGLILVQAWLVAHIVGGVADGRGLAELGPLVAGVAVVAVGRALLAHGAETAAVRSAASAKSQLRRRIVAHVTDGPARGPATAGELATLTTRGLDALDDYLARYLPQLVLAALVPLAVLAVVASADWVSALVIALTLPLVPLFMALVGMHTQARTRRQWTLLQRLGGHFLDVVEGLPTLALFRRAKAEAALVRRVTDDHRQATMGTLRIAFLSALVLELLATLAVALVAVEVGFRLLYGELSLTTALLVLVLAPEAYLPLREVGARFHASMEGVAAAESAFAVLESPRPVVPGSRPTARRGTVALDIDDVGFAWPGRDAPVLDGLTLAVGEGRSVLVTGRSGAGKSTLLALLLRFAEPDTGTIRADGVPLRDLDAAAWRARVAWVPQHPHLFDDTLAGNVRLGAPDATDAQVDAALAAAGLTDVVAALPEGTATRLGEGGARLSAGQRQRVAIARAFVRDPDLVLLDEPTAHLDPDNAALVRAATARLLEGRTGIVVAHDAGWRETVDETVVLTDGRLAERAPAALVSGDGRYGDHRHPQGVAS
ncbi:ABC transporter, CydDC cysteine exporter (CydDC-E) family, permease/ATP-binding protein CydD [Pseudonocardia dioxanivorans CB1190]|uniref:ABC transporter, CydDC cysteine exporter (CydDC-E) family, permease/ATP-binding protein CydD n=1 Tax=Pseudonocardia dioxanivorans (strain ATCC 55486 / DSM 44775 / JCM 13855 / CB1190) TaxID=675635 RepID=F4CT19_PSEUX|nr:thiol reductant ABC exporter subunit CydD [Pseudonocardia dioxanivorans]AEA25318.1 ABC transporter, CydDC cysteine exporter (CydDC-E) family, permease/ATP-binding protein CydD [Pseudonocardia dioxanivorans CB1190]